MRFSKSSPQTVCPSSNPEQVLAALASRQRSYLAEIQWKTVPWELVPKTLEHCLMDAIVEIPGIQEEFDFLESLIQSDETFQRRAKLIQRAWAVDSDMEKWSALARSETNASPYWPEFSVTDNATDDPQLGKVFPIAYRFVNMGTAQMQLYYWAGKILLHRTLRLTYKALRGFVSVDAVGHSAINSKDNSGRSCSSAKSEVLTEDDGFREPSFDVASLPDCPDGSTLWENACHIAQSMEYCTSDEMRLLGSQIVVCLPVPSAALTKSAANANCELIPWYR